MANKIGKIVLDVVLSFVVFIITVLIVDVIIGKVFGTTKVADGTEKLNGGGATTVTLFIISCAVTIAFAAWFYKFLTKYKITKTSETKDV